MNKSQNFTVTLAPHRSLTKEGFVALMVLVIAVNTIAGAVFMVAGAWPVLVFCGIDILLIWLAFRRNFSDARRLESITFHNDTVTLQRIDKDGKAQITALNRRWLSIELEYDEVRELIGRLLLRSHGVSYEIASFLGADERESLAKALRRAL